MYSVLNKLSKHIYCISINITSYVFSSFLKSSKVNSVSLKPVLVYSTEVQEMFQKDFKTFRLTISR